MYARRRRLRLRLRLGRRDDDLACSSPPRASHGRSRRSGRPRQSARHRRSFACDFAFFRFFPTHETLLCVRSLFIYYFFFKPRYLFLFVSHSTLSRRTCVRVRRVRATFRDIFHPGTETIIYPLPVNVYIPGTRGHRGRSHRDTRVNESPSVIYRASHPISV